MFKTLIAAGLVLSSASTAVLADHRGGWDHDRGGDRGGWGHDRGGDRGHTSFGFSLGVFDGGSAFGFGVNRGYRGGYYGGGYYGGGYRYVPAPAYCPPPVVYTAPAPVYAAPPVYYTPTPVYVPPPVVYSAPAPVYAAPVYPYNTYYYGSGPTYYRSSTYYYYRH